MPSLVQRFTADFISLNVSLCAVKSGILMCIVGSIPSDWDAVWYKFTKNGSGKLSAKDKEDGLFSPDTGDIVIDVYDSRLQLIYVNGTIPLSNIDVGNPVMCSAGAPSLASLT